MKMGWWKKLSAIVVGVVLVSAFTVSQAFSWGSATHAYIDDHIGRKGPVRNLNEIYGGMAPDVFNYLFSNLAWLNYLYEKTHYKDNILVWKKADTLTEKAVAFGFVSHNGITGADATAHGAYDYTLSQEPIGWVIKKAVEMAKSEEIYPYLEDLGLADEEGIADSGYELCHTFVETAVDYLMAQHDRSLGGKISAAALARTPEFPELLVKAYAKDFQKDFNLDRQTAVTVIRTAENEFRKNMVSYGFALMQEPDVAKGALADQLAALAPAFLSAYGITLSEGADLSGLSNYFLSVAIDQCQNDYWTAVEGTIKFISNNLANMKISY
jgi:hypothetical protein